MEGGGKLAPIDSGADLRPFSEPPDFCRQEINYYVGGRT